MIIRTYSKKIYITRSLICFSMLVARLQELQLRKIDGRVGIRLKRLPEVRKSQTSSNTNIWVTSHFSFGFILSVVKSKRSKALGHIELVTRVILQLLLKGTCSLLSISLRSGYADSLPLLLKVFLSGWLPTQPEEARLHQMFALATHLWLKKTTVLNSCIERSCKCIIWFG